MKIGVAMFKIFKEVAKQTVPNITHTAGLHTTNSFHQNSQEKKSAVIYGPIGAVGTNLIGHMDELAERYPNGIEFFGIRNKWITDLHPVYTGLPHGQKLSSYPIGAQKIFTNRKIVEDVDKKLTFGQVQNFHKTLEELLYQQERKYPFKFHLLDQKSVELFLPEGYRVEGSHVITPYLSTDSLERREFFNLAQIARAPNLVVTKNEVLIPDRAQQLKTFFPLHKSQEGDDTFFIPTVPHEYHMWAKHPEDLKKELTDQGSNYFVNIGLGFSAAWLIEVHVHQYGLPLAIICNKEDELPKNPRNAGTSLKGIPVLRIGDPNVSMVLEDNKVQFIAEDQTGKGLFITTESLQTTLASRPHDEATRGEVDLHTVYGNNGIYNPATKDTMPNLRFAFDGLSLTSERESDSWTTTSDVPRGSFAHRDKVVKHVLGLSSLKDARLIHFIDEHFVEELTKEVAKVDIPLSETLKGKKGQDVFKEYRQLLEKQDKGGDAEDFSVNVTLFEQAYLSVYPNGQNDSKAIINIISEHYLASQREMDQKMCSFQQNSQPHITDNHIVLSYVKQDRTSVAEKVSNHSIFRSTGDQSKNSSEDLKQKIQSDYLDARSASHNVLDEDEKNNTNNFNRP
jgi:hypothetical protein